MTPLNLQRLEDITYFYNLLSKLEKKLQGKTNLSISTGNDIWPIRGIYFFFESGELRQESGSGLRVTRIGTHALKTGAKTTLWKRLSQHKGILKNGGGNHRGSIFRLLVGTAIISAQNLNYPTWGQGNSGTKEIREAEIPLEKLVSQFIRQMPFIYLDVPDAPGPNSLRGYIEINCIALLSNYAKDPIDQSSATWQGKKCNREKVRESGLWNQNHVDEPYDPNFITTLEDLVNTARD